MPDFARGEVYYVYPNYAETGSEQWSGRPAVIVSADVINRHSACVEVVYLTTRPKTDYPTHVLVNATGRQSTAICEQITSVDKSRLNDCYGKCTPKEMSAIDDALRISLGIPVRSACEADSIDAVSAGLNALRKNSVPLKLPDSENDLRLELARAEASLATYKSLCSDLLDRLSATVCASA